MPTRTRRSTNRMQRRRAPAFAKRPDLDDWAIWSLARFAIGRRRSCCGTCVEIMARASGMRQLPWAGDDPFCERRSES